MDWLDTVTAALAIVVAPLALRNFLRNANEVKDDGDRDCDGNYDCNCRSSQPQFPQEKEPPPERQPDSQ